MRRIAILCLASCAVPICGAEIAQPIYRFRIESTSDHYLLGAVGDVELGPDGEFIFLDRQMSDIKVFDSEGSYLRTISRRGEGPGEMTEAWEIARLADGRVLIPCRMPNRFSTVWLDGTAGENYRVPDSLDARHGFLSKFHLCGDFLLLQEDRREREASEEVVHFRWLALSENRSEAIALAESNVRNRIGERTVYTRDSFPFGLLSAHPNGRVFLASERESYRILRFDAQMRPLRAIERDDSPVLKTQAELEVEEQHDAENLKLGGDVSLPPRRATKPNLRGLVARPKGWLYVQTTRAADEAAEREVVGAFDVFDGEGQFVGRLDIEANFDWELDLLHWTDEHMVIVRNGMDALRSGQRRAARESAGEVDEDTDWELRIEVFDLPIGPPWSPAMRD